MPNVHNNNNKWLLIFYMCTIVCTSCFSSFSGWQYRPLQCQLDDRCRPACSIEAKIKTFLTIQDTVECSHPPAHWAHDVVATLNQPH